jgi:hypothetical protein
MSRWVAECTALSFKSENVKEEANSAIVLVILSIRIALSLVLIPACAGMPGKTIYVWFENCAERTADSETEQAAPDRGSSLSDVLRNFYLFTACQPGASETMEAVFATVAPFINQMRFVPSLFLLHTMSTLPSRS